MPEEFDLGTLDESRILPARNRREAKRFGRQAFEQGQTAGTTTVVGGRNNSYKPRLTRAFNTGYADRQAEDYELTPDQVQIARMRNGDAQAFYDFTRKKNNRAAAQVGGGIGATAAIGLGAGTLLPYITGAAAVPAWMAAAGNEVAQSAGAFFNHPLTRFYFSKPVQGMQFALEATPVATKWAQTGERPSDATLGGLAFHAAALPFMGPVSDFTRGVDLINGASRAAFGPSTSLGITPFRDNYYFAGRSEPMTAEEIIAQQYAEREAAKVPGTKMHTLGRSPRSLYTEEQLKYKSPFVIGKGRGAPNASFDYWSTYYNK